MANPILLQFNVDLLAIIMSELLLESFYDFTAFFQVWLPFQSREKIRDVLARLRWVHVYRYDHCPDLYERERVLGFIHHCAQLHIQPAVLYICSKQLFSGQNIGVNLSILTAQSGNHFPSFFTVLVFRAIHDPLTILTTVHEMLNALRNPHMAYQADEVINNLAIMHGQEFDNFMPLKKLCPAAKNNALFDESAWPPLTEEILQSLCDDCGNAFSTAAIGSIHRISAEHISMCKCPYCAMQMILFKIGYDYYHIM